MRTAPSFFVLGLFVLTACSTPPRIPDDPVIPPPFREEPRSDYRVPETDETSTQAFLEQEIERRGRVPEPPPVPAAPVRQEVQTVYLDDYSRPYQPARNTAAAFPWATAYGASVGALIGSASRDAGEGAAIGAGIGFLIDLGRWASY